MAIGLGWVCAIGPGPVWAQDAAPSVRVEAFTLPSVDLTLAFTISGVVSDLAVRAGDRVEPGQVIARIDDRESAAQLALYRVRAESTLGEELAAAELELSRTELVRVREAFASGGMGDFELKRRELEVLVAEIRLGRAQQDRAEAKHALEQAEAAAERFIVRAPARGIVERTMVDVGESIERLAPVARVVEVDPVRIEASVSVADLAGIAPGAPVAIEGIQVAATLAGTVERIATVADAASGTVVVTIVAPNPDRIAAGARVWVRFSPESHTSGSGRGSMPDVE